GICWELIQQKKFFPSPKTMIYTIYFGGGTPSVLSTAQIQQILATIQANFLVHSSAEITLEANPDDLKPEYLQAIYQLGINRLSIGVQSFDEKITTWMNRSHEVQQAINCVPAAKEAGFQNISLDLIFGIPNQSLAEWEMQLQKAISLEVQHLSVYALTVEQKTALHYQVKQKKVQVPEDESYEQQFLLADQLLSQAGFEHYELSNYAKPHFHSLHNSAYWRNVPYLGVGPAAHSFDGNKRHWNVRNNSKYLQSIENKQLAIEEEEILTPEIRYQEHIMTHLRKQSGIELAYLQRYLEVDFEQKYQAELADFIQQGWMYKTEKGYALSPQGWLMSDAIIAELF
ncbi:MAG: radical SAM family heme chaperone HemW, partial [Bacteroidia bacterium]